MAEGAASKTVDLTETKLQDLKALAAASDNYGNFFGQNIFPVSSGVLLIITTLKEQGYEITGTGLLTIQSLRSCNDFVVGCSMFLV